MSAKFFYSHTGYGSNIAGSYIVGDLCFLFRMMCIIGHLETKEINLVTLLLTVFLALIDICLIFGVWKRNRQLVIPWLVCAILSFISIIIIVILALSYR